MRAFLIGSGILASLGLLFHIDAARAYGVKSVRITDNKGATEILDDVSFKHSNRYPLFPQDSTAHKFFEVTLSGTPTRTQWIQDSFIKELRVESKKVRIVLKNGSILEGMNPLGALLGITGKGTLGPMEYEMSKVRSIEFIKVEEIDWGNAATKTKKAPNIKSERKCVTTEGNKVVLSGRWFEIRDSYDANSTYMWKAMNKYSYPWRFSETTFGADVIAVEKSSARLPLPIKNISVFAITGRLLDSKPEVHIRMKNGTELTLPLLMKDKVNFDEPTEYGNFDEDDALVVPTEYGFEGISLSPLRPITVNCDVKQ